jgi:hypothetical protein
MPTQRRYIPPPPSEVRQEMLPNQTSIITRVHRSNQLIRAMEGREHTVVKVLRPRKKSLPDLPLSVSSSFDFDTFRFYLLEVEG